MSDSRGKICVRSIFISDLHIGTKGCRAEEIISFLKTFDCQYLYLVGDVFDLWHIRSKVYWRKEFTKIVELVLKRARKGTKVIYIPGNHDDRLRTFCNTTLGNLQIMRRCVHQLADGKRFLVCHGDEFDVVSKYAGWLAFLGDRGYAVLLRLNCLLNGVRRMFGLRYWSISAYVKDRVKQAVNFVGDFEHTLASFASHKKLDGVICGHIHRGEIRESEGILYCNDGDWVESCTALIENLDGRLELVRWLDYLNLDKEFAELTDQPIREEWLEALSL